MNDIVDSDDSTNTSEVICMENYEHYETTEKWLLGVVALPFICIGLVANALSVLIFSNRHMRVQRVNWYLLILAVSDGVILIGAFFVLTLPRLGELSRWWRLTAVGYSTSPYLYAFMALAQTISVWMTAAMSLHRFVGVCLPFKASAILETRNVKCLIFCVILVAVLFNTTRFFEVEVIRVCRMVPINVELPVLRPTALRMDPLYMQVFYEWAYTLIMFVVPFAILIVVNSMVILAIHRSRQVHSKLTMDVTRKQELAKEIKTSIMLVAIVLAFFFCNTLGFVVNIMEKLELYDLYVTFVPWSNFFVMTNASINFSIYCMFSDRYRQLFRYYLQFISCNKRDENFQIILSNF
ncbi:FMRFamide receptor [Aphelenchoides besseyi]|nr:FMRFamide receptor [Aphelenchoides besseyi]KAI6200496.1 FMRFamide receptor [Aphelenchoides besseyi]